MGEKTSLPPGFRFHPTDVELVYYYLKRKVMGKHFQFTAISDIDLYKFSPWDLPEKSCLKSKDLEWFFFSARDKKYPKGTRAKRSTETGYWKTTGQDRTVTLNSRTVGRKKTLVFHIGKPPRGERTDWVMYEYHLSDDNLIPSGIQQDAYVLCKIFKKSGLGPKIGAQYGAPFNEEEWEDYDGTDLEAAFPFLPRPSPTDLTNKGKTVIVSDSAPPQSIPSQSVATQSAATQTAATQTTATGDVAGAVVPSPVEMDGIQFDELAHLLMDSPYRPANALYQPPAWQADSNTDGIYNELTDLVNSIPDDNINNTSIQPVLSELGSENFVELNDIFALGNQQMNNPPFDWSLIQDNYQEFPEYPSQFSHGDVGGYLYAQGQTGPISELDHVVNPINEFGSNFWMG
ncbi:hypothetical protein LUZ60_001864 [Juncus effusus]|nr:hypothetical protein LUZ60_001864 [Juncus effusus]